MVDDARWSSRRQVGVVVTCMLASVARFMVTQWLSCDNRGLRALLGVGPYWLTLVGGRALGDEGLSGAGPVSIVGND